MSQKLYLDDCAYDKELVRLLEQAGHHVITPAHAALTGQADAVHLHYAAAHGLVLLTKNPDDFVELHEADADHAGILLIYQDNDPDRDMSNAEIVQAIANLVTAGIPLPGSVQVLNAWRY